MYSLENCTENDSKRSWLQQKLLSLHTIGLLLLTLIEPIVVLLGEIVPENVRHLPQ